MSRESNCSRQQGESSSRPPGQDVSDRLRLFLGSRELGKALDCFAKRASLGDREVENLIFVCFPYICQVQTEMLFLDH